MIPRQDSPDENSLLDELGFTRTKIYSQACLEPAFPDFRFTWAVDSRDWIRYRIGGSSMGWRALALSAGAACTGGCAVCSRHPKGRVPSGMQLRRAVLSGVQHFVPRFLTCSSQSRVHLEGNYIHGKPDEEIGDAKLPRLTSSSTPSRSLRVLVGTFLHRLLRLRDLPWRRRRRFAPWGAARRGGCLCPGGLPVLLIGFSPSSDLLVCRLTVGRLISVGTVVASIGRSVEILSGPLAKSYGWRGARKVASKPPTGMKLTDNESILLAREFVPRRRSGRGGCLTDSRQKHTLCSRLARRQSPRARSVRVPSRRVITWTVARAGSPPARVSPRVGSLSRWEVAVPLTVGSGGPSVLKPRWRLPPNPI